MAVRSSKRFGLIVATAVACSAPISVFSQESHSVASLDPRITPETFSEDRIATGRDIAKGGSQAGGVGMKCMACHGLQGAGGGDIPRLAALPYDYLVSQLQSYLDGGRVSAVMAPISAQLTASEAQAVLAYYADLPAPDIDPPSDLDWQLAKAGEVLAYAGRRSASGTEVTACVMCHNAAGDLDEVPIAPPLEGQPTGYIEAQLTAWKTGQRRGDPLGTMARIAEAMTDEEISAVAAFYASRNPAEVAD
ncbi:c-type cytochrome [uncultured Marivita sp.]|uniref:c-type cytochrome n=1 Tax=uncultured Marivita sp. TaxID=888080 RepID=UPI002608A756|nr:c-type cytochrome [uncultured Marivita sp.]